MFFYVCELRSGAGFLRKLISKSNSDVYWNRSQANVAEFLFLELLAECLVVSQEKQNNIFIFYSAYDLFQNSAEDPVKYFVRSPRELGSFVLDTWTGDEFDGVRSQFIFCSKFEWLEIQDTQRRLL